eukprot:UN12368
MFGSVKCLQCRRPILISNQSMARMKKLANLVHFDSNRLHNAASENKSKQSKSDLTSNSTTTKSTEITITVTPKSNEVVSK